MIAKLKILMPALMLLAFTNLRADTCDTKVSLLTCSTGDELYAGFGHTAIRVQTQGMDIVFNYGTFNFDEPDFYSNFVKGRLKYYLSAENFSNFLLAYQYERRNVYQQELLIDCSAKQAIFNALRLNIQEANKYYAYDFLKDNCTSRSAEILLNASGRKILLQDTLPPIPTTYRKQIHETLHRDGKYWSALGIDLLMGLPADEKLNAASYARFLPFNLMEAMDHAYLDERKIFTKPEVLIEYNRQEASNTEVPFTPLLVFTLALALLSPLHLLQKPWIFKLLNAFDRLLFLLLGLMGVLLIFTIYGTDHKAFSYNFNLLWALPTHLFLAFLSWKRKWIQIYFRALPYYSLLLLIVWGFLPQELNLGFLPIVAWIGFRGYFHYYGKEKAGLS